VDDILSVSILLCAFIFYSDSSPLLFIFCGLRSTTIFISSFYLSSQSHLVASPSSSPSWSLGCVLLCSNSVTHTFGKRVIPRGIDWDRIGYYCGTVCVLDLGLFFLCLTILGARLSTLFIFFLSSLCRGFFFLCIFFRSLRPFWPSSLHRRTSSAHIISTILSAPFPLPTFRFLFSEYPFFHTHCSPPPTYRFLLLPFFGYFSPYSFSLPVLSSFTSLRFYSLSSRIRVPGTLAFSIFALCEKA
jgi:hypothetical protein